MRAGLKLCGRKPRQAPASTTAPPPASTKADESVKAYLEALAAGEPARAASLAMGRTVWRDPQYRSVAQYADALTKYKAIGVPDEALWRMIPGVTEEQVTEWIRMRDAQAQAAAEAASAALSAFGPKDGADEGEGQEDEEGAAA